MSPVSTSLSDDRGVSPSADTGRRGAISGMLAFINVDRALLTGLCAASIGFFSAAYAISLQDPDYFDRRLLATMRQSGIDPMTTGAVAASDAAGGDAIPVPRIVRSRQPVPGDYQIVMIFENEAILATQEELWRVKVGSILPGLGEVLEIDPTETGGVLKTSEAMLRSVAR